MFGLIFTSFTELNFAIIPWKFLPWRIALVNKVFFLETRVVLHFTKFYQVSIPMRTKKKQKNGFCKKLSCLQKTDAEVAAQSQISKGWWLKVKIFRTHFNGCFWTPDIYIFIQLNMFVYVLHFYIWNGNSFPEVFRKVLGKFPLGKFPPGIFPLIKLPLGKFAPPGKFPPRKLPPGNLGGRKEIGKSFFPTSLLEYPHPYH